MKIKSLLIGMLACSALVACTNDDLLENNEKENQKAGNSYLAVKLVSPSASSRALEGYANGNENEQAVTNARFYLFKSNGDAYTISDRTGKTTNFVDATNFTDKGEVDPNVETILSTVLVIDESKTAPPAKILAVLNYPVDKLKNESKSLSQLQSILDNFGTINAENGAPYTTKGNFVMSNSAYVDATGNIVYATPIAAENIKTSAGDAHGAPVKIYVERVAAKVQTKVEASQAQPTDKKAQTFFVKDGKYYAFTGQKDANGDNIYARLKGWRVTNIASKSKLIKSLETTAEEESWNWNNPAYYRSYWADDAGQELSWAWNFNQTNLSFDDNNWEYYNENTKNSSVADEEGENSQLLVAAEFVTFTEDGDVNDPQPIAEWYGVKYTLNNLKTQVAGALADKLFTKDANDVYNSITGDAITFTQVETDEEDRYISKIGVVEGTYYYKSGEKMEQYNADGKTTLASVIDPLQHAKIWGNIVNDEYVGGGYYYVDIEHETTDDATIYGLVRNHWYLLTLKSLNGLGTPVYDPEQVIITEKPDTDYSYISAEINVLAWRMVSQSVDLD